MTEFTIDKEYRLKFNPETGHWDTYRNDILLSKSTEKLYKYYPLNLYSIDVLLRNYIFLANPASFNDPFDCNINLCDDKNTDKIKCKKNNYSNLGICSLSETIDNHLMWAHYTNNYNGFAIEFDGENIDVKLNRNNFGLYTLTRVIYPEKPAIIKSSYKFATHYVLTTKYKYWQYEKEWSIIVEILKDERELFFYPEKVKGIYIGYKIPDENMSVYKLILEICEIRYPKTPIYVVYPHPTNLELKIEKVI